MEPNALHLVRLGTVLWKFIWGVWGGEEAETETDRER